MGLPVGRSDAPVAKVTVTHAEGAAEEFILKNGIEFADYNGSRTFRDRSRRRFVAAWPGSHLHARTSGKRRDPKITLESYNNAVAPTFVAITAEVESRDRKATQLRKSPRKNCGDAV